MDKIDLATGVPNQQFTATLSGNRYEIRIVSADGVMAYDLYINEQIIVEGFRFVNQQLMIPYVYQEVSGNLLLDVPDDETPNYENFEVTQFLYFLDSDEATQYRANRS